MLKILIFTSLISAILFASLADKRQLQDSLEAMKDYSEPLNKSCKTKIVFEFEPKLVKEWHKKENSEKLARFCGQIMKEIEYDCRGSEIAQKAIASQIKKIVCILREENKPEKHELKSGVLKYSIETKTYNSKDREWLDRHIELKDGLTLSQAREWAIWENRFQEKLKSMNSTCETEITFSIDKSTFKKRKIEWAQAHYCDSAMEAVESRCKDNDQRKIIASKVKKIACVGTTKEMESTFTSFNKGVLTYEIGTPTSIDSTINNNWLEKNVH